MTTESADDIHELRELLSQAKRPRVQTLLSNEIANLEKQIAAEETSSKSTTVEKHLNEVAPLETKIAPRPIHYTTLSTFSWDEESDKVKIYISLEGATQEKASVDFQPESVHLKVHDVNGKNYQFSVPRLAKAISPSASKVLVKPKRIILTLKKASTGSWYDLAKKEDKLKPPSVDKEADPMAGLMGLMKNMYEEGDDEMKKTIAKAWTDARTGKGAPGSSPAGMDF
jgi:calcyclin binding protein